MPTDRIGVNSGTAPNTDYLTQVDWVSQNQAGNYSTLHIYIKCINRGFTGSYNNNQGSHTGQVDNVGSHTHSGTLPSGVATNGIRWYEGPAAFNVTHDGEGNLPTLTIRQIVTGWSNFNHTIGLAAPPRIPKAPRTPGTPTATEVTSTSMRLSWTGSTDSRGSAIDFYLLRRWDNASGTGSYVDSVANNLTRVISGLTRNKAYSWRVYAHNTSADNGGYSIQTGLLAVSTLAEIPSTPGTPRASEITSSSMRISWTASTDNGGKAITHYKLRRYDTSNGTGSYVDSDANNLTRLVSGLSRYKTYSWRVYAYNGYNAGGYSYASGLLAVSTLAEIPSTPGTPVASEILPQSMRISWAASTDNGGKAITSYKLRRYETNNGTGGFIDTDANNLSRVISGLTPGHTYSWRVYSYNGYSANGYSAASGLLVKATLAPARLKVSGVYAYGIPYVKIGGVYRMALPYVKIAGVWKQPT